ncbi:hypothetical protein [Acetobacter oryzifermentans]|uniref:hypothetical protein n=1 Tax=Acetobacter oryzifermentans TaxID=1633874 RepID=UPI000B079709|nr:hypothetical protein [Acetobacter oryzifermentans]
MTSREYAEYQRLMDLPFELRTDETEGKLAHFLDYFDGLRDDFPPCEGSATDTETAP